MTSDLDIKPFLDDPSLLTEAIREVIDALDSSDRYDMTQEKEAQLREIAKSIERMEKAGVGVPDVWRAEKTRLVAELATPSDEMEALNLLADEMEYLLQDLKTRIGRGDQSANKKLPRPKKLCGPRTSNKVLRDHILRTLKKLGGSARVADIVEEIGGQLEGNLLPGDLEWRESTHEFAWQNNVKWERFRMVLGGLLRTDSPRGYWELSEDLK